ncbi:MAG: DUF3048 domain-containing protein [Anaerolineales bacterium]
MKASHSIHMAAALLYLVSGCGFQTAMPTPPFTATITPTALQPAAQAIVAALNPIGSTSLNGEIERPPDINPLTGLRVPDPELLLRPPVAVKISNYPRSVRPQWGLSLADIVYEYYHNNDLTRFHAIYYSKDADLVGPIRSGRLFDGYLVDTYQSILAFASADSRVLARLSSEHPAWQLIGLLSGPVCPPRPVCRYTTDNYLVASTKAAREYALARGGSFNPPLQTFRFDLEIPADGELVNRIYMRYSYSAYSYWDYDEETGFYKRYQDTLEAFGARGEGYEPLMDQLTGEQISAESILVLYVPHFHTYYVPQTEFTPTVEVVDMEFEGRGKAFAFRDGMAYELRWDRESDSQLYLIDSDGKPFPLKPGNTWIEIFNDDSKLLQEDDVWRFEFVFRRP